MALKTWKLTSGCSFTGTNNFSCRVTTGPWGSGRLSGSRAVVLLWKRHNRTLLISEVREKHTVGVRAKFNNWIFWCTRTKLQIPVLSLKQNLKDTTLLTFYIFCISLKNKGMTFKGIKQKFLSDKGLFSLCKIRAIYRRLPLLKFL